MLHLIYPPIFLPTHNSLSLSLNLPQVGIIAGGGRTEKPLLKAGAAHFAAKAKRKCWPTIRGCARNPVEHPHGGGNHQHVGHPTTVQRASVPGQKSGLIAARRTGRHRGGQKNEK